MPFRIEHVYNTITKKYEYDKNNVCYYDDKQKHKQCSHRKNCIFKGEKWEVYDPKLRKLTLEIREIRNIIKDYENIINHFLNGDIIYHEGLDEYYDIEIQKELINGKYKYKTIVHVNNNFNNYVKHEIKQLRLLLSAKNREKWDLQKRIK